MNKTFIFLSFAVLLLNGLTVSSQSKTANQIEPHNQEYLIKAAAYWTSPVMDDKDAKRLSLYKIIIVDGENLVNNPDKLIIIKKLNSNAKLICYFNPMELFYPIAIDRPTQSRMTKDILQNYPEWLLKTSKDENVIFFPGMIMLNLSTNCPQINGETCGEYLARKNLETLNDSIWDGSFNDNGGGIIDFVNSNIDSNNDQIADNPDSLNMAWSKGMHHYLSLIKKGMRKNTLLLANKGSLDFLEILDGRMLERFPNNYLGGKKDFGWHQSMINAQKTGNYTIFEIDSKDLMFGLASALLTDNVYVAIGQDNATFHPELNFDLGKPLSPAQKIGSVYVRFYERGKVEVFPSLRKGIITLNNHED